MRLILCDCIVIIMLNLNEIHRFFGAKAKYSSLFLQDSSMVKKKKQSIWCCVCVVKLLIFKFYFSVLLLLPPALLRNAHRITSDEIVV